MGRDVSLYVLDKHDWFCKRLYLMNFFDYSLDELEGIALAAGGSTAGAGRLFSLVYRYRIAAAAEADGISRAFIRRLDELGCSIAYLNTVAKESSCDGTVKYCFELDDGTRIESVLIPGGRQRYTLCVSSQAGCARGCDFCVTASMGLRRNLSPGEIVSQVTTINRELGLSPGRGIDNVVLMGMGEPLDNFDNVLKAVEILQERDGLALSDRKITLSTCGITPRLRRFAGLSNIRLAVSLHAADEDLRSRLMPVNRIYPLAELIECCREIAAGRQRMIMFEYALICGINDSEDDAHKLARLLQGIDCKINLLAFNAGADIPYTPSSRGTMQRFRDILTGHGFLTLLRHSRGDDIAAACGQLAARG